MDASVRHMAHQHLSGIVINTACPHCKQHFEVGLGLHNNARDYTGMTPNYFKADGYVVEDDMGLTIPDKPARETDEAAGD